MELVRQPVNSTHNESAFFFSVHLSRALSLNFGSFFSNGNCGDAQTKVDFDQTKINLRKDHLDDLFAAFAAASDTFFYPLSLSLPLFSTICEFVWTADYSGD